jgi:hypothetical protein
MNLTALDTALLFGEGYVIISSLQLVLYKWGYARGVRAGKAEGTAATIVAALRGGDTK